MPMITYSKLFFTLPLEHLEIYVFAFNVFFKEFGNVAFPSTKDNYFLIQLRTKPFEK